MNSVKTTSYNDIPKYIIFLHLKNMINFHYSKVSEYNDFTHDKHLLLLDWLGAVHKCVTSVQTIHFQGE